MKENKRAKPARVKKINKKSTEWIMYQQLKDMLDILDQPKDAADIDVERLPIAPLIMLKTIL